MSINYSRAIYSALALANEVSPTSKEQRAFSAMHHRTFEGKMSDKERLSHLINAIKDAVDHGNYPSDEG
jgi:hypothetical protein